MTGASPAAPVISFILPAWNEEAQLGRTLRALTDAADGLGEAYEIIVVDDASTDGTAEVARTHGAQVVPVALRQIAAVRNAGARVARGSFLFFVDADTVVPARTLVEARAALADGAVGGGCRVTLEGPMPFATALGTWLFMVLWNRLRYAAGCFAFARREAFDAVGGWDEAYFAGEEMFLSRALKKQGRFVIIRHPVVSSGRKARLFKPGELYRMLARTLVGGRRALQQRRGLEMWYELRREPPSEKPRPGAGSQCSDP